ncbi:ribokinase [Paenibacillaceae bacterium]|nr:ribokinase [Paenibacillaceae bacterium]
MGTILAAGSINMDVVNGVAAFPLPGETITGKGTEYHPGGKGANQAVAAARSGSPVVMLGAVGSDSTGQTMLAELQAAGIRTSHMMIKEGHSGMAFITVSDAGENTIVLSPGSNSLFSPGDISLELLQEADMVLLQNEIPWETNKALMQAAADSDCKVVYNPAPAHRLDTEILPMIDTLVLNETEASVITGQEVSDLAGAEQAAEGLIRLGVRNVIITLGSSGSYYASQLGETLHMPAFKVEAVDTTAAGDTFIGAYAASLHQGRSRASALGYATAAAAIAVTKAGAQHSVPYADEIAAFLERNSHA